MIAALHIALRFVALSTMALLLCSTAAMADCTKPAWPDPASLKHAASEKRFVSEYAYQTRVHEFIVCQRGSLEKRASGLEASAMRQIILQDRAAEDRALAELDRIGSCIYLAGREPDPEIVRTECEGYIESRLKDRRPPGPSVSAELKREQHSLYGGVWSYRTLNFGQPGRCMDGPCSHMFGIEVTNMTPVVLSCEVTLTASNQNEGSIRGEQVIRVNPGDSLPAAQVHIYNSPDDIESDVRCSPATPFSRVSGAPAACALNWLTGASRYPTGWLSWESGAALLEFTVGRTFGSPEAIRIVQADSPEIGRTAQSQIEQLGMSTNCPGQRFGLRVEYRPFPCYDCFFEGGMVTVYREDRAVR